MVEPTGAARRMQVTGLRCAGGGPQAIAVLTQFSPAGEGDGDLDSRLRAAGVNGRSREAVLRMKEVAGDAVVIDRVEPLFFRSNFALTRTLLTDAGEIPNALARIVNQYIAEHIALHDRPAQELMAAVETPLMNWGVGFDAGRAIPLPEGPKKIDELKRQFELAWARKQRSR
jgi:hypothetical protein